ncbi:MAG: hypothetical protein PHO66_03260 [Eubacteriales bacterium]|nr:hypothetical protein [Eubacteriales bacterium]
MEDLYTQYLARKEEGTLSPWESLTKAELRKLYSNPAVFDTDVARLFDISVSKVRYRRKKYGLDRQHIGFLKFFGDAKNPQLRQLQQGAKDRLFGDIDQLAIGLAHYFFRNGPVEDMHANGQLSDDDIKTLNKYIVDRIARALLLATESRWLELEVLLAFYMEYGAGGDKPDRDLSEIDNALALLSSAATQK